MANNEPMAPESAATDPETKVISAETTPGITPSSITPEQIITGQISTGELAAQHISKGQILNPHGAEHEELREIRDRLAAQSGVVMRLGMLLLSSGASAYRVKLGMARLAQAVGLEEHHSAVTFGEIITSAYGHGTFRTEISEQRTFGTNAARLDSLRVFIQNLHPAMLVEEVHQKLDQIEKEKPYWPALVNWLASGIACACFCFLNRGGLVECLLVGVAATIGQACRRAMMHRHMNHFGVWMFCALVASSIYISLTETLFTAGLTEFHPSGIISAILFLVPGFPLVTSILDLVRMDFSAGISRLTYVILLVISAGISVWLIAMSFQWKVDPPQALPASGLTLIILRFICSFVASYGFAILFSIRPRICFWAALVAASINTLRLLAVDFGMAAHAAVGFASLAIGLLSHLISIATKYRYSRVSLSVPAVVIMIPGVPLYAAITHLAQGNFQPAVAALLQVIMVILAIGLGLAIARMLTDPGWRIDRDTARPHQLSNDVWTTRSPFRMR